MAKTAKGNRKSSAAASIAKDAASDGIHDRALQVWLTIRTWSARKYDRKASSDTTTAAGAVDAAGRFNKFLLPADNDDYKALITISNSVRGWHYDNTLAWSDEGWRILPTANYIAYTDALRAKQKDFNAALDRFLDAYPMMKANAQRAMGKLFSDDDYPPVGELRRRFELTVSYAPVPAVGDIRVNLDAHQIAAIEAGIMQQQTSAVKAAAADAWERLHDVVTKIHERLSAPDAIFRDSLITNARQLCDSLTRLNVTNDSDLEAMRARVAKELTNIDPDVLRDQPKYRADVAGKADAILKSMSGLFA